MSIKVALINSPWWVRYCPPYILGYFAAYLRGNGHEVSCFDLNNRMYHDAEPERRKYWEDRDFYSIWENKAFISQAIPETVFEKYVKLIGGTGARVAVFVTHTPSVLVSYEIAKRLKENYPGIINIFMGHKASRAQMALDFIKQPFVDYVCPGEADIPLKNLLAKLEDFKGWRAAFRKWFSGKTRRGNSRGLRRAGLC